MAGAMRAATRIAPGFVTRPSVSLAMPWIFVCAVWFIGILITAKFTVEGSAEYAAEGPIAGLLSSPALAFISVVNALFLVALGAEARIAWKLPPWMRNAQLAGVALCIVNLLLVQWGAILAHDPLLLTR